MPHPVNLWIKSFILLIISFLSFNLAAQVTLTEQLEWEYKGETKVTKSSQKNILWFSYAVPDETSGLPLFLQNYKVPSGANDVEVFLKDAVYQLLSASEAAEYAQRAPHLNRPTVEGTIVIDRKMPLARVVVNPFRTNPQSGKTEKLISFTVDIQPIYGDAGSQKSWSFANHSVLASGSWYKLGVSGNGIYKLGYTELQSMGVAVDQIDPRNIAIFGQGGKPLPEYNSLPRPDDLLENAIYIYGESDGRFDPTDYILFYGVGVVQWNYLPNRGRFYHQLNKFSPKGYYFLSVRSVPGKRIGVQSSLPDSPDYVCDWYQGYTFHENDSLNLIKSGREFYGEVFDLDLYHDFSVTLHNPVIGSSAVLTSSVLARSTSSSAPSYFDVYINGTKRQVLNVPYVGSSYTDTYAYVKEDTVEFPASSTLLLRYVFNRGGSASAIGWLNFFDLNYTAYLSFPGGQLPFRNGTSIGKGVTEFSLAAATGVSVWNVTDPWNITRMDGPMSGSTLTFRARTDSLLEFVAHNGSNYYVPELVGLVNNQDLHQRAFCDMAIVAPPEFEPYANTLADLHRNQDGLDVVVVRPEQVFNEFSSGAQDPTAIRSYMKMFYDRAGGDPDKLPKYLLLFGDGSYDNMNRVADNTNYIVTWETLNSLSPANSYTTDDYYAFLDDLEYGGAQGGLMDIAVGRLPVKSVEEAAAVVDKIVRYCSPTDLASTGGASCSGFNADISNFSDWRNVLCFVADDADQSYESFLGESENITLILDTLRPEYNIDKIYFDAYPQESTPGGQRYPDVTELINKRVEKGALIMNYIGHGGETGWAHEAVLTVADINGWSNHNNLPLFVTATCEFSRYDDPGRTSAGEYVLLNPNGGGIALFTTTRLAYTGSNADLNKLFYTYVFKRNSEGFPALGEAVRTSKNGMGCVEAIANFCLLGDPAVRLAYPRHQVATTQINFHPVGSGNDTIRALGKVTVCGEVRDVLGNKLTGYNGILYPAVFDKRSTITSLGNDEGVPRNFSLQKNIIYKGKASVTAGDFNFSFLVPKDIAYQYGKGKFSYYTSNGTSDGNGYFMDFVIGGTESASITDKEGPHIDLFLNDEKFVNGGITNPDPFLFAKVSDSGGVNTVGSGIGHDIAAVLDNNTDKTMVLNDYYESDLNTYQSGVVRYPFDDLEPGAHYLSLKVWDVFNNSSEKSIDFVVADAANLALDHVLNYPNPFTTYTEFWFEHNQPCCGLDVQVQIFTITGRLIKTITTWVQTTGYRADPIPWDGLDDYGDPIGKGVYLYKLKVTGTDGSHAEKLEKLVILR